MTTTEDKTTKRTPWWYRLFGRLPSSKDLDGVPPPKEKKKKKKTSWTLFSCCRRKNRVSPICDEDLTKEEEPPKSAIHKKEETADQESSNNCKKIVVSYASYGLPNPSNLCYMNSSLQSLLTLTKFIVDVSSQEEAWNLLAEANIMTCFLDIVRRGHSNDPDKLMALISFKSAFAVRAPQFADYGQEDAHEFIMAFMDQIRSLAAPLRYLLGRNYICPVEANLMFSMDNTRTCKSCGDKSVRQEEFTNLSLDLLHGESIQQMLQVYQSEVELDFTCQCGGKKSGQESTFRTLPRYLVLHLKRFKVNKFLHMVKVQDSVNVSKKLVVKSSQDECSYSLVSAISHLGAGAGQGHYVCDGIYTDPILGGDRWLHFDDANVVETSDSFICHKAQKSAYILFYQKQI